MPDFPSNAAAYISGIAVGVVGAVILTCGIGYALYRRSEVHECIQKAEEELSDLREKADGVKYKSSGGTA